MIDWARMALLPGGFRRWGSFASRSTGRRHFFVEPQGISNLVLDASRRVGVVGRARLDQGHTHIFGKHHPIPSLEVHREETGDRPFFQRIGRVRGHVFQRSGAVGSHPRFGCFGKLQ